MVLHTPQLPQASFKAAARPTTSATSQTLKFPNLKLILRRVLQLFLVAMEIKIAVTKRSSFARDQEALKGMDRPLYGVCVLFCFNKGSKRTKEVRVTLSGFWVEMVVQQESLNAGMWMVTVTAIASGGKTH